MTERISERYSIHDFVRCGFGLSDIRAELQFGDMDVPGTVIDISVSGAGVELVQPAPSIPGKLRRSETLFVMIVFLAENILVNARPAWSALVKREGQTILKCGLEFTVISPEDTLKLSAIIDAVRKNR